jgi:hypothetical protein
LDSADNDLNIYLDWQSEKYSLSFREQLTRYYHKESSSPRVAIADRGRWIIRVIAFWDFNVNFKTSLLTSMIKQSNKFNEKIQIKRTPAKAKSNRPQNINPLIDWILPIMHRWLALSFREQLTRYYHKESSSPRVAIAVRGRWIIRVIAF